ncbi:somatostatin receptor type 4-like [Ylistrum balloti]|uniref:somatostatin receptor type 4-like n=1 Tax=Ylistrum balloti TaxID=509963 RepID=UPI002905CF43|nr:somatostatin receptor type 4-like [Ylistrum balloti]
MGDNLNLTFDSSTSVGFRYENMLCILVLLVTIIGIPGTIVTMRFYGKRIKKSSTSTALYLSALAVFDMLSLLSNIPGIALEMSMSILDEENAIAAYFTRIPKYWSNLTLLLVGIERVVSVVLPHKAPYIFTRRVGTVSVIVIIVIAPVVLLPLAIEPPLVAVTTNGTITHVRRKVQMLLDPDVYRSLIQIVSVLYFGIPVFGVFISNICLVTLLYGRFKSKRARNIRDTMTSQQVRELRTTKLIMLVTVIFIICVLPLVIIYPVISISGEPIPIQTLLVIHPMSSLLESLNYSMNVVVYFFGSSNFRTETRQMLSRVCGCCRHTTRTTTVTPETKTQ